MSFHTLPTILAAGAAPAPAPAGDDLPALHRALRREVARGPDGLPAARTLLRAALAAWWGALAPDLPLRPAPADPAAQRGRRGASGGEGDRTIAAADGALAALAARLGRLAAGLPPAEAAHAIGTAYTAALEPAVRKARGAFHSPPALAARLADEAGHAGTDWARARVLDPASGGGALLLAAAARIVRAQGGAAPADVLAALEEQVEGWELDPDAAWLAQVALDVLALPLARAAGRPLAPLVAVRDALADPAPSPRFDLVIANPPYGRVTLTPEQRARFARSLHGHANLYGLFVDLALRLVRPGGTCALVTPASWLGGRYFQNLRTLVAHEAPPVSIGFVRDRRGVFAGAVQETILVVLRRAGAPGAIRMLDLEPLAGGPLAAHPIGTAPPPAVPAAPWLLPRAAGEAPLAAALAGLPHRLADWGWQVSTGPLIRDRHAARLFSRPSPGSCPLIEAGAITRGALRLPHPSSHALFLAPGPAEEHLLLRRPALLLRRTTSREEARRLVAARLTAADLAAAGGAVAVENHVNVLRPVGTGAPAVPPGLLLAVLGSAAADRAYRCLSGSVAVSAFELEALPLPAPQALAPLEAALGRGAAAAEVDAICAGLFGPGGPPAGRGTGNGGGPLP